MNELENQLRSWAPRRPSARLERSLFHSAPALPRVEPPAAATVHWPSLRLGWLAPAMGLVVLFLAIHTQRKVGGSRHSTNAAPLVAMILSNQTVAYLPAIFQGGQNGPPADTFEWTNGNGFTSSVRSLWAPRAVH